MPPKRRPPKSSHVPPKRPSKLAKENNLTAAQEREIREAFSLFAVQHPHHEDSQEGVLRVSDVRRCLKALNLAPSPSELPSILETIDPMNSGFVPFIPFFEYAAIAIHDKVSGDEDENEDDEDEGSEYREESNAAEVRAAYSLFTHGAPGPITLAHLRRVARELREDLDDEVLKDMILEANGGIRSRSGGDVGGVRMEEFEAVMRRAGISFS
ncbi:EF-hand superfamily Ca2+-modulated protein [Delitschia confertaspora ATCC 74209]|uniref:Calmodulin n=1 Tax=Delitschia confertaspora ATCC 74209 TaxID=1513339 RepID=A0A9P4N0D2_9PLEO|nr:EF-hand superfamily Ca2+-modulated protein [Delitschia confertaspora ATCC 74209]